MSVDIIGGGIGGLTTAIALQQKGIKSIVFEQAPEIKPVGAGIILASNAMQVYSKLGLHKLIIEYGRPVGRMNITDPSLKPISGVDLEFFEEKYGVGSVAIHRGVLQQILVDALRSGTLQLDYELEQIVPHEDGFELHFNGQETVDAQYIIGADGLRSKVRAKFFPDCVIRDARQVCWRGVVDFQLPAYYKGELNEAWGRGKRFGFVEISSGKVYWYALCNKREQYKDKALTDIFSDFHPLVKEILAATATEQIHYTPLYDLQPMDTWHTDHMCLVGDAAHAATPNLGQGACQAIEDAFVLSAFLAKHRPEDAFREYKQNRISKAHYIVNTSWTLGKLAHWRNPLAVKFRNTIMKLTPDSVNRQRSEEIFKIPSL